MESKFYTSGTEVILEKAEDGWWSRHPYNESWGFKLTDLSSGVSKEYQRMVDSGFVKEISIPADTTNPYLKGFLTDLDKVAHFLTKNPIIIKELIEEMITQEIISVGEEGACWYNSGKVICEF